MIQTDLYNHDRFQRQRALSNARRLKNLRAFVAFGDS